jgi:hypothetical protein
MTDVAHENQAARLTQLPLDIIQLNEYFIFSREINDYTEDDNCSLHCTIRMKEAMSNALP